MTFWVYILKCVDDAYYTGHTDSLEKRIAEHQNGFASKFTASRRPIKLVFTQPFSAREESFRAERQIKGWSRKKESALIRGDWKAISQFASTRNDDFEY